VIIVARVITVNDVLDGHVVLDIECLDRIYLNAYVPILHSPVRGLSVNKFPGWKPVVAT